MQRRIVKPTACTQGIIGVARGRYRDPYRSAPAPCVACRLLRSRRRARSRRVGSGIPRRLCSCSNRTSTKSKCKHSATHTCFFLGLCSLALHSPLPSPLRGTRPPVMFASAGCPSPSASGFAARFARALGWVRSAPRRCSQACFAGFFYCGSAKRKVQGSRQSAEGTLAPSFCLCSFCVIHLTRKGKNRLFPAAYPLRIITQNIIHFA